MAGICGGIWGVKVFISNSPPETRDYPSRVELAKFYFGDSCDFLARYNTMFDSDEVGFQSVKSRRLKCYLDLHFSLEALFKAIICLRSQHSLCGKALYEKIRSYSHKIQKLREDALLEASIGSRFSVALDLVESLDVGVRYQFDAMNLRMKDDALYYKTVGNDDFLRTICEFLEAAQIRTSKAFCTQRLILTGEHLVAEVQRRNEFA